jgi:hypothetical protein
MVTTWPLNGFSKFWETTRSSSPGGKNPFPTEVSIPDFSGQICQLEHFFLKETRKNTALLNGLQSGVAFLPSAPKGGSALTAPTAVTAVQD